MMGIAAAPCSNKTDESVPDWSKADIPKLNQILSETDWSVLDETSAEESWTYFKQKLNQAQSESVPLRKRRTATSPPWMNRSVLRAIRKKRRRWKKYK